MQILDYTIQTADNQHIDDCINLSKQSRPEWRSKNEKLGTQHIAICVQQQSCLVALFQDNVIGFLVRRQLRNKVHINDIFVLSAYRGQGIAQRLMEVLTATARSQGYDEIMSDMDIDNEASKRLHERNSFVQSGHIQAHRDNVDSLVFTKKL